VTQIFSVIVLETNTPPLLDEVANRIVHAGSLIQFTNSASDADLPSNTLTFSLLAGTPAAAGINSTNGIFSWQTTELDSGTTNDITVVVADNGSPNLGASRTFTATIMTKPTFQSIVLSNTAVMVTWSAIAGQTYQLETNNKLGPPSWGDCGPSVLANGPTAAASDGLNSPGRFYRVRVLP